MSKVRPRPGDAERAWAARLWQLAQDGAQDESALAPGVFQVQYENELVQIVLEASERAKLLRLFASALRRQAKARDRLGGLQQQG